MNRQTNIEVFWGREWVTPKEIRRGKRRDQIEALVYDKAAKQFEWVVFGSRTSGGYWRQK